MAMNQHETRRMKGTVRGRESRDRSVNTKLTASEFAAVAAAAEADGRALGEWMREVLLKEIRTRPAVLGTEQIMTEIIGLQLFLTNVLSPIACGLPMTAEEYQELMRNVKATKHRAARELIAQRSNVTEEDHHDRSDLG